MRLDEIQQLARGAIFDDSGRYCYLLWRELRDVPEPRTALFIMLNPSTADETTDGVS